MKTKLFTILTALSVVLSGLAEEDKSIISDLNLISESIDFGDGTKKTNFLIIQSSLFQRKNAREYKILIKKPECSVDIVSHISDIRMYFELSYLLDTSPKYKNSSIKKIDNLRRKIIQTADLKNSPCTEDVFIMGAVYSTLEVFYGKNNFIDSKLNKEGITIPDANTGNPILTIMKEKSLDDYLNFLIYYNRIRPLERGKLGDLHTASKKKIVGIYACEDQNIEIDRKLAPYDLAATVAHELMHQRFSLRINSKNPKWSADDNSLWRYGGKFKGVKNYFTYFDEFLAMLTGSFMQAMLLVELKASNLMLNQELLKDDFSFVNFPKEWSYQDAIVTLVEQYYIKTEITPEFRLGSFLVSFLDAHYLRGEEVIHYVGKRNRKTQEFYQLFENLETEYFPDIEYYFHQDYGNWNQFTMEYINFFEKESFDLVAHFDDKEKYELIGRTFMEEEPKLNLEIRLYGLVPIYNDYHHLIDQLDARVCNNDDMPGAEGVGISRKYKSCIAIGN